MSEKVKLSEAQKRVLFRRAETIHKKAAELFGLVEKIVGEDDREWLPFFGDTMCSAYELRNMLEEPGAPAGREALKEVDSG